MIPTLDARISVRRDGFTLDLSLQVEAGEVVALLGPNGAGKTTALRVLAGLLPLDGGQVRLGGELLDDASVGLRVPAERRAVGVVFQDYLLFPHLSALENVAFGLRCQGVPAAAARDRARAWLERVGLEGVAGARPGRLSGGQAQRVALARALAPEPRLLLLDEPLAALDARTRLEVRARLRRHLADYPGPAVLVTHDPLDAMVLADRLVVLERGRAVQQGAPAEVARRPRSEFVARLVGLNLYRGVADGSRVRLDGGAELTIAEPASGEVLVAFPPSAVALYRARPDGSPRNLWRARVDGLEPHGTQVRAHLAGPIPTTADVTPAAAADLDLHPGQPVWAAVKATETHAYPA